MTLGRIYFLICEGADCPTISPSFDTPAELRRMAKKIGWERLHHPESVELGYVDPSNTRDNRGRQDYCPTCAPAVRNELIALQARMAQETERETRVARHVYGTH